jgi:hypothetical protein
VAAADVWLGVQRGLVNPSDVSWSRQQDAPFTPRSHLQLRAARQLHLDPVLYVVGGQTNHSCGLRELGVCSSEVWRFRLMPDDSQPEAVWQVSWDAEPLLQLPFTPRCQPAMLVSQFVRKSGAPVDGLIFVGGQLSFEASQPCSTQPQTVSELWFGNFTLEAPSQARWWRLPDAPFSPRRYDWSSPHPWIWEQTEAGPSNFGDVGGLLIGGLRHVSTSLVTPGVAQLNHTEISADIWRGPVGEGSGPSGPPLPSFYPFTPAGSMAVPTAAWADDQWPHRSEVTFGGITSDGFIRSWLSALPPLDQQESEVDYTELAINVTLVHSLYRLPANGARAGLPLSLSMTAAELADPYGNYELGSEWSQVLPSVFSPISTFHHQPLAFAAEPGNSSWFVPQAASSANTTRPLLNFSLRRHSHRYSRWLDYAWVPCGDAGPCFLDYSLGSTSGGRSGSVFYNDWITTHQGRCLPPVDPSFAAALGPVRLGPLTQALRWNFHTTGTARPYVRDDDRIRIGCQHGHHLEPPSKEAEATLYCTPNGMWMDLDAFTIRRCVRNVLNCSAPLVDVGDVYCAPPPPVISRASAFFQDDSRQYLHRALNVDNVTLIDVPVGISSAAQSR